MRRLMILTLPLLMGAPAFAGETPPSTTGKVTAGGAATSGNSDTQNANASFTLTHTAGRWTHGLSGEFLHQTDRSADGTTGSAQKFAADGSTRRTLGNARYGAGTLHYEQDRSSGYRYRAVASVGYGMTFAPAEGVTARVAFGPGWRRSQREDDGTKDEAIGRLAFEGAATLGAGTVTEKLTVTTGSAETTTESATTLSAPLARLFALEASMKASHTDTPPPGKQATDTTVTLALAYNF